jgi:SAM-dependent methyltransferase/FKBP-type peptidyl-prolyl cis-trans isomerase 2
MTKTIHEHSLASLELSIKWSSGEAMHVERYLARRVNLWRDMLPPDVKEQLMGMGVGDIMEQHYKPGDLFPLHDPGLVYQLPRSAFRKRRIQDRWIQAHCGRFYPRGMLGEMPGVFPQDIRPGRIIALNDETMTVDLNHPLAGKDFHLLVVVANVADKVTDTGGRLTCWMEEMGDSGPGMQARYKGKRTDYGDQRALERLDQAPDTDFYDQPRMVAHVDSQASAFLREYAWQCIKPGARVLDLMSSVQSHLPLDQGLDVVGLGLNATEMEANPALSAHLVHDLNAEPEFPLEPRSLDAVVCNLSIEYLTRPKEVLAHCARVLRPGGRLMLGFSNRWFPEKALQGWMDLHEFERMGLVLDYLVESDRFENLSTVSIRNWWRPEDDPHHDQLPASDPVYIVTGTLARE